MHLTNYSLNRHADDFVENSDGNRDDDGHKWSLAAMWRKLRSEGSDVDTAQVSMSE